MTHPGTDEQPAVESTKQKIESNDMKTTDHEEAHTWDEMKTRRDELAGGPLAESTEYRLETASIKLGRLIHALRTESDITQEELASRMASTQPHIAKIEAGGVAPTLATLQKVASALNYRFVVGMVSDEEWADNDNLHELTDAGHVIATA